jgi:hypothetical protein
MANKRGRPTTQPKSPHQLKQLALEGIHRTQRRYREQLVPDVEELCETVDALTHRNRFTQEEMNELKMKVNRLYDEFVVGQMADDERMWSATEARIASAVAEGDSTPSQPMTEEEWRKLHRLRPNGKRKPGPLPKKKKTIYEIPAGTSGLAEERTPSLDCDEIERQWMENYIEEQKNEPKFLKGKRVRNDSTPTLPAKPAADFWI